MGALLPVRPFTLKKAARIWGTTEAKAEKVLDHLCEKALLVDSTYRESAVLSCRRPWPGLLNLPDEDQRGY